MRFTSLFAAIIALTLVAPTSAATALRLEIAGVVEAPGKMTVTVATSGPDGRPVPGLTADNFKAAYGEKALIIKEAVPAGSTGIAASVLVMSDASKAMTPAALGQIKTALPDFINGLAPGDKVGLVAYNTNMTTLIDVTPDRGLAVQAVNRLGGAGDADVYAAVIDATRRAVMSTPERRMVVLISAGAPLASQDKRLASINAARNAGVMFYTVAMGDEADRGYLGEVAEVTGGRMLDAPNANAMRPVLSELAGAIRTQYALVMEVPVAADRTQAGRLDITLNAAGESTTAHRMLAPLQGAAAPTFPMKATGLASGQRIRGPVTVEPSLSPNIKLARVEFTIDGEPPVVVTSPPFSLPIDPATLSQGNHIVKIVAIDASGRRAELQVPFAAAPPPGPGRSLPIIPVFSLLALAALGYLGFRLMQRRQVRVDASRARAWTLTARPTPPIGMVRPAEAANSSGEAAPVDNSLQGYVIVMDERPEMRGKEGSIREYELRGSPLTFGVGAGCNISVDDTSGEIGHEEARIWVQKRRLVYHKLTTLSAMATEGMTSGWLFLDDGDEMRVGSYRLVFRAVDEASGQVDEEALKEAARNFGQPNLGSPAA